jgi:hypothetical protein
MNYLLIGAGALALGVAAYYFIYRRRRSAGIVTPKFEDPGWDQGDYTALENLRGYVERRAEAAIAWYYEHKRIKAVPSRIFRYAAIILTGISGLTPIIISIAVEERARALSFQQVGYLSVGLAALFIALDRFSGSSTAWMRFITSAMTLETLLEQFRLDWQRMRGVSLGQPLSLENRDRFLQRLLEFSAAVRAQIERETQEWVKEFQTNLAQLEEQARTRLEAEKLEGQKRGAEMVDEAKARRPGIINLTVENVKDTDAGYSIFLDDAREPVAKDVPAREFALPNVAPGLHTIRAEATIQGRKAQASRGIDVKPNELGTLTLQLTAVSAAST